MKAVAHKALFRALRPRPESGLRVMSDGFKDCPYCGRSFTAAVEYCSHCELPPQKPDAEDSLPVAELPNDLYCDWSHDTGEDEFDREEYPWLR